MYGTALSASQVRTIAAMGAAGKAGFTALPNQSGGVNVTGPANGNTVGGTAAAARNVISGNANGGVFIDGDGNTVQGNYIGTDPSGTVALGNAGLGVVLGSLIAGANNNLIGGSVSGAGNVISGNTSVGVLVGSFIPGVTSDGNAVRGNIIGLAADGSTLLANGAAGVFVENGSNNTVGGSGALERNVISGNAGPGVQVAARTNGTSVLGNYIGTESTGTAARPNTIGVQIEGGATDVTVGGTAAGARNVISGNTGAGVAVTGTGTIGNEVLGNYIGTTAAGTAALANGGPGVNLTGGAARNYIGLTAPDLWVASEDTNSVLRFSGITGLLEPVSATGGGLTSPRGITFGPDGNLYATSRTGATSTILRYDAATGAFLGVFVTAGSGGLNNPHGLVFGPDGNLYVSSRRPTASSGTTGRPGRSRTPSSRPAAAVWPYPAA